MLTCEICEKTFTRKDSLGKHYMDIHKLKRDQFPESFFGEKETKREAQKCQFCNITVVKLSRHLIVCKSKPSDNATKNEPQKRDPVIPPSPIKSSQFKISQSSEVSKELRIWMVEKLFDRRTIEYYLNALDEQIKMIGQRRMTAVALNKAFENFWSQKSSSSLPSP